MAISQTHRHLLLCCYTVVELMMRVTSRITIDETEISERFVRASGPGGQHVNKVATAVQLRFDLHQSSLPKVVQERLIRLAGKRINDDGELIILAQRYRQQQRNRDDARARLVALIRRAASPPKRRKKTRPSAASKAERLNVKRHRGKTKQLRRKVGRDED